jgi:hypothetical protein
LSDDPLTTFVSRSLRAAVSDVRSEPLGRDDTSDRERIRYRKDGAEQTLILKRVPPGDALETQLLPFLVRKSEHAPRLLSRGVPPPAVPAWPWVLIEDVQDAASACERDAREIVRAKVAIERSVARDEPALRALGVPSRTAGELVARLGEKARRAATLLDDLPRVLCHGALVCENARVAERGVVLLEWRRAHLGCGLLDVARLASDIAARGDSDRGESVFALYAELTGISLGDETVGAATLIDTLTRAPNK